MDKINDPQINDLLKDLLFRMQEILGDKLLGLYLYGSLVWGDFDKDISDLDMLAVLESDLTDSEFAALKRMHDEFAKEYKEWDNRIEVQYLAKEALKTFKTQESPMTAISPGEPFHKITVNKDWLMNWYCVQEYGVILFGSDPKPFIDHCTKEEFIQGVKKYARGFREYVKHTKKKRPAQAYVIMTMCRALYTITLGEHTSKKKACEWVAKEFPEYAPLIYNAFQWRKEFRNKDVDSEATYPQTEQFVNIIFSKLG
ncbi:MAG TPA: aminoglycoside adenylyltransferase domain-containing protein [Patescibacteria group bacterium]|nr:aminoglycoside adenylyltransferase domain-containing protein [Patescibacteria group bacterium]